MGKITIEVKINTFGTMLYSLNHPKTTVSLQSIIFGRSNKLLPFVTCIEVEQL